MRSVPLKRQFRLLTGVFVMGGLFGAPAHAQVVINEVYGGGGNANAPFKSDFVELRNLGLSSVNLNGYSVQYASATGAFSSNSSVNLTGNIAPGAYYLIKMSNDGSNGVVLPAPDATKNVAMSATDGRVALANTTDVVIDKNSMNLVDLVGYGSATLFEGSGPAPAPSATRSITRNTAGLDTNNNNSDFATSTPPTPTGSSTLATTGAIISEFRFRGPGGSNDEYVELYNTTNAPLNISGWSIRTSTGEGITQDSLVPANTIVPAFGHFLFTSAGYSLGPVMGVGGYGASDALINPEAADDSGVALLNAVGAVQDAAGFDTSLTALREGAGLASAPSGSGQHAFMRRFKGQSPVDTGDNAADFLLLTTDGAAVAGTSIAPQLGAQPRRSRQSRQHQRADRRSGPGRQLRPQRRAQPRPQRQRQQW